MSSNLTNSAARECIEEPTKDILCDGSAVRGGGSHIVDRPDVVRDRRDGTCYVSPPECSLRAVRPQRHFGNRSDRDARRCEADRPEPFGDGLRRARADLAERDLPADWKSHRRDQLVGLERGLPIAGEEPVDRY